MLDGSSVGHARSAAHVEGSSKHHGLLVFIREQSVLAVVDDDVVHRREVMFADVELVAVGWNDWKVMYSVAVGHRQGVLTLLHETRQPTAPARYDTTR